MRQGADAGLLLIAWAILSCLSLTAVALPVVSILVHGCWLAADTGLPRWADGVAGLASGAAVLAAAIRGAWHFGRTRRHRRHVHARHAELTWLLTGTAPRKGAVLWLPTSEPHAYSLAGEPPLVVMSDGLRACLDQGALGAVTSHEHAHIHRRHHLFIAVAQALSAGLGWLPLARQSPTLVRTMIELDADAHAARVHGSLPLRQAIRTLQYAPAPAVALGIAADSAELRLTRLMTPTPVSAPRTPRSAATGAAVMAATTLVLAAWVLGTGLISC
jgi:Zn-dependent protease with chaperone function